MHLYIYGELECERSFLTLDMINNVNNSIFSLEALDMLIFIFLSAPHFLNEIEVEQMEIELRK